MLVFTVFIQLKLLHRRKKPPNFDAEANEKKQNNQTSLQKECPFAPLRVLPLLNLILLFIFLHVYITFQATEEDEPPYSTFVIVPGCSICWWRKSEINPNPLFKRCQPQAPEERLDMEPNAHQGRDWYPFATPCWQGKQQPVSNEGLKIATENLEKRYLFAV